MDFTKLQEVISDALQKPLDTITKDKTLFVDLEVESVEALELEFSLEEEFEFSMNKMDLWKLPAYLAANDFLEGGKLNSEGKDLIRKQYLSMTEEEIEAVSNPSDLHKFLTIGDVFQYVQERQLANAA